VRTVRLAYRDHDRAPIIFCIKEMAERHYGVAVEVLHIENRVAFEAALFDGSCDVIIEHLEYLYAEAANGKKARCFARRNSIADYSSSYQGRSIRLRI
jgi:hypothetical protein